MGIKVEGFDEAMKSLDKLAKGVQPIELAGWSNKIESFAKQMCGDSSDNIVFKHIQGKELKFSVKDEKSRDCLVKAIESYAPTMPILYKGFFNAFGNDIKNMKFNQ